MTNAEFVLRYRELALAGKSRKEIAAELELKEASLSVKVANLRKKLATKKGVAEAERLLPKLRGGAQKVDVDELFNVVNEKLSALDALQAANDETPSDETDVVG